MSANLPEMLDYPGVEPRGITTEFQKMRFSPLTSFNSYVTNDIVRFWIPMIEGFWDPYKSYLEIEVEVNETEYTYGKALQVDNSASSFISEMTVFVDSKEVERIQQYDTIAAILHDVNYTPGDEFGKEYEGHGYNSYTSEGMNKDQRVTQECNVNGSGLYTTATSTMSGITSGTTRAADSITTAVRGWQPQYPQYVNTDTPIAGVTTGFACQAVGGSVTVASSSGFLAQDNFGAWPRTEYSQLPNNISTMTHMITTPSAYYNDVGKGNLGVDYRADNSENFATINERNLVSPRPFIESVCESSTYGVQATNAYNFSLSDPYTLNTTYTNIINAQQAFKLNPGYKEEASVSNTGYTAAWSEELSNSSNEPVFSPAHGQSWITDGEFLPTPLESNEKIFQIPIISSVLGVLIPIDSYKLLPMEAFKNLLLEFRLNEFAMFTSGYNEDFTSSSVDRTTVSMDSVGQLKRNWEINRFELYGAIFSFDDFVTNMMRQKLASEGLILSSCGWSLGPQFSIPNTMAIKNSWQINAGYESVEELVFRIGSDDYKKYSFCREHYYLSGNIESLQLEIANTYIPPQPIIGHAGNIIPYGNKRNNAPFIIELHSAFGELFNIGQNTYINSTNFAINDRPYNPTNTLSYANSATGVIQNIDTASGLPLFHENRCVGRALYAFDLESLPGEENVISGLNTLEYRPFEVQIDVDGENQFTRDSTLYFFLCYDVIYKFSLENAPEVYGRGG